MDYTKIVDGYQIRDVVYLFGGDDAEQKTYDIVKWVSCDPHEVRDLKTGKMKTITRYCYSVGHLKWDESESCFQFTSIGTRFLEDYPPKRVVEMILDFCEKCVDGEPVV